MNIIKTIINWIMSLFRSTPVDQEKLETEADVLKKDLKRIQKNIDGVSVKGMSEKEIEDYFNK